MQQHNPPNRNPAGGETSGGISKNSTIINISAHRNFKPKPKHYLLVSLDRLIARAALERDSEC